MVVSTAGENGDPGADGRSGNAPGRSESQSVPGEHPLDPLLKHAAELREYGLDYLSARRDEFKSAARRLLLRAAAVFAAFLAVLTLLAAGIVLCLNGLAAILSAAWGKEAGWGQVVVGAGALTVLAAACAIGAWQWNRVARKKVREKYEHRHQNQRATVGTDVAQRAAAARTGS
jgi:hypothetical protein